MSRTKLIAVALLLVAAAAGWWGYGEHQKREQRKAIVALLADTAAQLKAGIAGTAGGEAARKLDEQAVGADRNLASLKSMNASRQAELAEAADDYLLTGREILKRLAAVQRYRQLLSESQQALIAHMRADDHSGAWVQQAVKAHERAKKDHRDLGLATDALDKLLASFPESQKKVAPYVEPGLLIGDDAISAARARALEALKQATAEIEKTSRLDAFR